MEGLAWGKGREASFEGGKVYGRMRDQNCDGATSSQYPCYNKQIWGEFFPFIYIYLRFIILKSGETDFLNAPKAAINI